jgi:hypothetical protein
VVLPAPGEAELTDVPDGVAILAVPGLIDDPASDTSTALVVSNRIPVRGDTGVAIGIFDANGLVATRCLLLGASETAYLDADLLGLPAGFKGSAVISAVTWDHPTSHDGVDRNLVGLAADLVRRSRSANADQAADVAHTAGVPLLGPGSELTRALICGEFPPRPTSTPTRLPGVYLPMVEVPPRATPTP